MSKRKRILVLCTGNSCRSQMAEAYLRHFGGDRLEVYSAGVKTHGINPSAVAIMREDGIDIGGHTCNHVDEYAAQAFDIVLTVCDNAREQCPVFVGAAQMLHHTFPDPAGATGGEAEIMAQFRAARDLIKDYCRKFVEERMEAENE